MNNKRTINISILECNPIALVTRRHFACNLIQLVFLWVSDHSHIHTQQVRFGIDFPPQKELHSKQMVREQNSSDFA